MTKVPSLERGAPADTPSYVKNSSFLSRDIEAQKAKKDVPKEVKSPPISTFKVQRSDSKTEERPSPKTNTKDNHDKMKSAVETAPTVDNGNVENTEQATEKPMENNTASNNKIETTEESGVGDKIKKFEKAAEDASGKLSRPGSVRGRNRTERLGSDGKDDLPLPPPPDLEPHKTQTKSNNAPPPLVRQSSLVKAAPPIVTKTASTVKWAPSLETDKKKVDSQRIIRPECKQPPSPADATIRSPALGSKLGDTFPSRGTAFRNVAADHRTPDEPKTCKKKACATKGSGYFTRGSEEIWLVKKKDIEEIEERVLDSFRRGDTVARGSVARRQGYARSESLDPQWAARAHTLQRQSSVAVACTCGHDKKPRAKSAGADTARPRARSHADDAHVLDKYETLV